MLRLPLLLALVGCYAPSPRPGAPCGEGHACPSGLVCSMATQTCELASGEADAGMDASACYGTGLLQLCVAVEVPGMFSVEGTTTLDTSKECTFVAEDVCVVAANRIAIKGTLRVVGARPLALLALKDLDVEETATVDAASHGATPGPGSHPLDVCAVVTPSPLEGPGGAGGSFGGAGGAGGLVDDSSAERPAQPAFPPARVHGGCSGQRGGRADVEQNGGHGGGALYLLAGESIGIAGTLNASGSGGSAKCARNRCGGQGGGAGGLIGLDAPSVRIDLTAQVFANGGGGASGGGSFGNDGEDPASPGEPARGGGLNGFGGIGGTGAAGARLDGARGGDGPEGGGGGGGGAGVVLFYGAATIAGAVSPAPM